MIRRRYSMALVAGAALLLVGSFTAGVRAQGDGPGRGPFGHRWSAPGVPGLAQLELTEAQRDQIRDVRQRYRQQLQEAGTKLRDAHDAQRVAVETIPVNEGLIRSTAQALANAQTEMALVQARMHNDVWSLLTPEQQEKAKQLKSRRESRAQQRRR